MSAQERYPRPPLRYRRFGGGYRREDVEFALAELRLTLRQLDKDLESLRERNRELQSDLQQARAEVESFRRKEHDLAQTMAAALHRAAEIEAGANARAREIIAHAEQAASRIHAEADRRAEDSTARFNELLHLRDNVVEVMRSVVGDFDQALSRVEHGEQLFSHALQGGPPTHSFVARPEAVPGGPPPPSAPDTASIPASPPAPGPAETAEAPTPPPPSAVPPAAEEESKLESAEAVFDTSVELDAGPFSDFAALSAFERSLVHLPKVEDVYVRRLSEDRALIELTLSEPAPLLQTMKESLPYELAVRSASRSKLVVDVAAQTPAGTR